MLALQLNVGVFEVTLLPLAGLSLWSAPGAGPRVAVKLTLPWHGLVIFCVKEIVPVAVVAVVNRPVTVLVVILVKRFPPCFHVNVNLTFLTANAPVRETVSVPSL